MILEIYNYFIFVSKIIVLRVVKECDFCVGVGC